MKKEARAVLNEERIQEQIIKSLFLANFNCYAEELTHGGRLVPAMTEEMFIKIFKTIKNVTFINNLRINTMNDENRCPECGSTDYFYDTKRNEFVCRKCFTHTDPLIFYYDGAEHYFDKQIKDIIK